MKQYELKVYDDGECAVRKIKDKILYPTNLIFSSRYDLHEYLKSVLCIRWPIEEVLKSIDYAKDYEWIDFK